MSTTTLTPRRQIVDLGREKLRELLGGTDDRDRAKRGAVGAFAIRIGSAGLAYASQVLLARWMGAHDYGIFAYCWVWLTVLGIATPIGLNTSVMRFVPEYFKTGRFEQLRGLLRASRWLTLGAATVFALVGALVVWATNGLISTEYEVPLYLMLICLPLFALTDTQEGIARARSWVGLALLPPYIVRPALLLVLLAAAVGAGFDADAETAVLCAVGATWGAALGQMLVLDRRLSVDVPAGPRAYAIRTWIMVSLPLLLVEGFFTALSNTDVIVLNIYRGPSDAAIYYAALKTTTLISFIYYAINTVFVHRFAEHNATGDREALAGALRDAVTWVFWPSLAAAVGILIMGWPLLWLFGPEFTAAYPVMFILVVGLLARASVGPVEYMLSMLGQEKTCAALLGVAAAVNIGLNFALIPPFGLIGAAVATASSMVLAALMLAHMVQRKLGMSSLIWTVRKNARNA